MPALWSRGPLVDRLVAGGVFVYAFVLYLLTMAPTASFWDSGEFIAIAHGLQVSHPPGAPFYMLVGRFFSMVLTPILTPFVGTAAVAVALNLVSVVASALTVLVAHLVIVRLIRIWKGRPETWTAGDRLVTLAGGVIGACAFAVTDSFWFNAVEAEVYALSMLFTALVVWLILVWRDETMVEEATLRARGEHPFGLKADRRLLLIAYLFGLAIGVHLLNVLTLFFIALVVFFLKVDRPEWSTAQRWLGIVGRGRGGDAAVSGHLSRHHPDAARPRREVRRARVHARRRDRPVGGLCVVEPEKQPARAEPARAVGRDGAHRLLDVRRHLHPLRRRSAHRRERPRDGRGHRELPQARAVRLDAAAQGRELRPPDGPDEGKGLSPPLEPRRPPPAEVRPVQLRLGLLLELPGEPHVHPVLPVELHGQGQRQPGRAGHPLREPDRPGRLPLAVGALDAQHVLRAAAAARAARHGVALYARLAARLCRGHLVLRDGHRHHSVPEPNAVSASRA